MELNSKLADSDYKIIKCAECQALSLDMPYDVQALHAERQALRDRINAIDEEIATIPDETPEVEIIPEEEPEAETTPKKGK